MRTKYVNIPTLKIGYEERGSMRDPTVILLHGFPDDVRTWDRVTENLVNQGFRTITPYLRGVGKTIFIDSSTPKFGDTSTFGSDFIEFTKALGLKDFILVGHDLGADASFIVATMHPRLINGLVLLAVDFKTVESDILSFEQAFAYWYAWFFNTQIGKKTFQNDLNSFCKRLWKMWSPSWDFDENTFNQTAKSFQNPDFLDVFIHNYNHLGGNATRSEKDIFYTERASKVPSVDIPTIVLHGADDKATLPQSSEGKENFFLGFYDRKILKNTGHFIQRENPKSVVEAIITIANL